MWAIVHAISGMAVGHVLGAYGFVAIVFAALALHVLLDLVPHWDYTRTRNAWTWVVLDVAVSAVVLVVARVGFDADWKVIVAGVVSMAPDLDVLDSLHRSPRRVRFPSHWTRFPHGSCAPLPGVLIQMAVVVASAAILLLA